MTKSVNNNNPSRTHFSNESIIQHSSHRYFPTRKIWLVEIVFRAHAHWCVKRPLRRRCKALSRKTGYFSVFCSPFFVLSRLFLKNSSFRERFSILFSFLSAWLCFEGMIVFFCSTRWFSLLMFCCHSWWLFCWGFYLLVRRRFVVDSFCIYHFQIAVNHIWIGRIKS